MKKILVIEDNTEVRENLEEILELSGYAVESAPNGKIGVELALKSPPDLILCDVMMPELDGYGVLHILSKKSQTANIPFVFLTAKAEKMDFRKGMNLGADDYITKPFYKDELLSVLETRLAKSERLKQEFNKTSEGLTAFINEARGYEELKKLSQEQKTQVLKKKATLFEEGDYPRYLYFIKSGKIKLFKTNEDGKEYIISILKEGDFIGYIDLIKNSNYTESAATLEESEVSLIPRKDFMSLLYANRDVSSRLIQMLADNISEKEDQLLQLAYNSVRKRVADALLLVYDRYHEESKEASINILRDDLARIVGTAKESVIRMLSDFKDEGLIDIDKGVITILNKRKLETLIA